MNILSLYWNKAFSICDKKVFNESFKFTTQLAEWSDLTIEWRYVMIARFLYFFLFSILMDELALPIRLLISKSTFSGAFSPVWRNKKIPIGYIQCIFHPISTLFSFFFFLHFRYLFHLLKIEILSLPAFQTIASLALWKTYDRPNMGKIDHSLSATKRNKSRAVYIAMMFLTAMFQTKHTLHHPQSMHSLINYERIVYISRRKNCMPICIR